MANIHKQTLRVVFNKHENNYNDLLVPSYEISIHQKHLQFLVAGVFNSTNKLNTQFLRCFFENHEILCNLSYGNGVKLPGTITAKYVIDLVNYRDEVLWNTIPKNIKLSKTLPES